MCVCVCVCVCSPDFLIFSMLFRFASFLNLVLISWREEPTILASPSFIC